MTARHDESGGPTGARERIARATATASLVSYLASPLTAVCAYARVLPGWLPLCQVAATAFAYVVASALNADAARRTVVRLLAAGASNSR